MSGLTEQNYYSNDANQQFMSVSQYKNFIECEAAALAELNGEYLRIDEDVLVAGSYLHAWNEGVLDSFKTQYSDTIYNKKGEPYAAFKKVDEMISVLENDVYCMDMLQGDKEVIIIGEFAGALWKGKIDVLNTERGYFTDLKSTRSIIELRWSEKWRQRVSFIEEYDYMIQAAVYAEIERQSAGRDHWLNPVIVAVSKEDPPDKAIISLTDINRLSIELEKIEDSMPRILAVKNGFEQPRRCGACRYCRSTKQVDRIINYMELGGDIYGKERK